MQGADPKPTIRDSSFPAFYGYATSTFTSSKIEDVTYDSVAFRYIAANSHPDHNTIANFRKQRFISEINVL
jgi:transposase